MANFYDVLQSLYGFDLSSVNQTVLFCASSLFIFFIIQFFYEILIMLFGYIGGKRK